MAATLSRNHVGFNGAERKKVAPISIASVTIIGYIAPSLQRRSTNENEATQLRSKPQTFRHASVYEPVALGACGHVLVCHGSAGVHHVSGCTPGVPPGWSTIGK
jgi:hypothetical protein